MKTRAAVIDKPGAAEIVAVDPSGVRRDTAMRLGASNAVEPNEDDLPALQPEGYDYVFEAVGRTRLMEIAVRICRYRRNRRHCWRHRTRRKV